MKKIDFSPLSNITIGSDPEEFLQDLTGRIVSAEGKIGGSKESPRKLSEVGHAVQEDNVMIEYNIPPVVSEDDFVRELNLTKDLIMEHVLKGAYTMVALPSANLQPEEVFTEQGQTIGCEPDYNAYTGEMNEVCDLLLEPTRRFCGGHIHIGTSTEMSDEQKRNLIKFMDIFVGCPSSILDTDEGRKNMYGQLGRMRFTSYGVEYRTVSNWWLESDKTKRFIYKQTMKAIEAYNKSKGILEKEIEQTLLNKNYEKICKRFKIPMLKRSVLNQFV